MHISNVRTSLLVHQAISENLRQGATVYTAFLDIKKAFDSVWLPGFFYKLQLAGFRQKPWKILRNAYQGFQCAVLIAGQAGQWFCVERGVHQGAPLSMPLYQVFINDLIVNLRNNENGLMIGNSDV